MLRITIQLPPSLPQIRAILGGLCDANIVWLRERGGLARPLFSGWCVYRREPDGEDDWQTAERLLRNGYGDCEDVAAYRVMELRALGIDASPDVVQTRRGKFHAVVRLPDGTHEDPSRILALNESKRTGKPYASIIHTVKGTLQ